MGSDNITNMFNFVMMPIWSHSILLLRVDFNFYVLLQKFCEACRFAKFFLFKVDFKFYVLLQKFCEACRFAKFAKWILNGGVELVIRS